MMGIGGNVELPIPSSQRKLGPILLFSLSSKIKIKIKMGPSFRWDDGIGKV